MGHAVWAEDDVEEEDSAALLELANGDVDDGS